MQSTAGPDTQGAAKAERRTHVVALTAPDVTPPREVLQTLERKGAQVIGVRSAIAAMAELGVLELEYRQRSSNPTAAAREPIALLIVEPERLASSGTLRDAVRRHFPLVAVWACRDDAGPRLAPLDEPSPPTRDATREDSLADDPSRSNESGQERSVRFPRIDGTPSLRLTADTTPDFDSASRTMDSEPESDEEDDSGGVVSAAELSMLLQPDPDDEDENDAPGAERRGSGS